MLLGRLEALFLRELFLREIGLSPSQTKKQDGVRRKAHSEVLHRPYFEKRGMCFF